MRSRPLLFVSHARFWRLRRVGRSLRPHRLGVVAPLAVAAVLAAVGHEVSAPAAASSATVAVHSFDSVEAAGPTAGPAFTGSAATRQSVARTQPARATRSRARKAVAAPEWVRPSRGALTSFYGPRWGRMHRGIDFGASYGSPIYAASDGTVTFAGSEGGYGRLVTIRHKGGWTTAYGHMSRTVVRTGQRVTAGQVIAYVGSEGRSTGPHLHFEVRRGGAFVNPLPFLRARGVRV